MQSTLQLPDAGNDSPQLAALATRFVADRFADDPTSATNAGFHTYDDRLPDLGAPAYARRIANAKRRLRELEELDTSRLSADDQADAGIIRAALETDLAIEEDQELWRHSPSRYTSIASSAVYAIFSREFAPLADRMRSAIARERAIPALLEAGRANTTTVDPITAELAITNIRGAIAFFRTAVPAAFAGVADPALQAEFKTANDAAVGALEAYAAAMESGPLAQPGGTYAIGPALFERRLELQEGRPIALEHYENVGLATLAATQAKFVEAAQQIDASKTPQEVYRALGREHPAADDLLSTAQQQLASLRAFVESHRLMTLPAENDVRVVETPTFNRQTTLAAMNTPGAFETVATQAYYYVTPVEPSWSDEQKAQHLAFYNRYAFPIISAHEVVPGHYVNFVLHKTQQLSLVRALAGSASYTEGWAHYCEQMMVDEGLGDRDPRTRLAQLGLALQREARYIVGLREHTQGMTVDEGTKFFVDNAYLPEAVARREAMRGTADPLYGCYTLGKLEVLKLREDYRRKLGSAFTLQRFHDAFLAHGNAPIAIVRRFLLGADDDGRVL